MIKRLLVLVFCFSLLAPVEAFLSSDSGSGSGGSSVGGADTQVQFNNAGALDGDANFIWNDSTGRLGLGTASPSARLDIGATGTLTGLEVNQSGSGTSFEVLNSGSGDYIVVDTSKFVVDNAGNVGIGLNNPTADLHLYDSTGNTGASLNLNTVTGGTEGSAGFINFLRDSRVDGRIYTDSSAGTTILESTINGAGLAFFTEGSERVRINDSGNLGIGVLAPAIKLTVNGSAATLLHDLGDSSGTYEVDPTTSNNQKLSLSQNTTLNIDYSPTGTVIALDLPIFVVNGGSHVMTYNGNINFPGGTDYVISTTNGAVDHLSCKVYDDRIDCSGTGDFQ